MTCQTCKAVHSAEKGVKTFPENRYLLKNLRTKFEKCLLHNENVKLFCVDCSSPICGSCRDSYHGEHNVWDLQKGLEFRFTCMQVVCDQVVKDIQTSLDSTEDKITKHFVAQRQNLKKGKSAAFQALVKIFEQMTSALEKNEEDFRQLTQRHLKTLKHRQTLARNMSTSIRERLERAKNGGAFLSNQSAEEGWRTFLQSTVQNPATDNTFPVVEYTKGNVQMLKDLTPICGSLTSRDLDLQADWLLPPAADIESKMTSMQRALAMPGTVATEAGSSNKRLPVATSSETDAIRTAPAAPPSVGCNKPAAAAARQSDGDSDQAATPSPSNLKRRSLVKPKSRAPPHGKIDKSSKCVAGKGKKVHNAVGKVRKSRNSAPTARGGMFDAFDSASEAEHEEETEGTFPSLRPVSWKAVLRDRWPALAGKHPQLDRLRELANAFFSCETLAKNRRAKEALNEAARTMILAIMQQHKALQHTRHEKPVRVTTTLCSKENINLKKLPRKAVCLLYEFDEVLENIPEKNTSDEEDDDDDDNEVETENAPSDAVSSASSSDGLVRCLAQIVDECKTHLDRMRGSSESLVKAAANKASLKAPSADTELNRANTTSGLRGPKPSTTSSKSSTSGMITSGPKTSTSAPNPSTSAPKASTSGSQLSTSGVRVTSTTTSSVIRGVKNVQNGALSTEELKNLSSTAVGAASRPHTVPLTSEMNGDEIFYFDGHSLVKFAKTTPKWAITKIRPCSVLLERIKYPPGEVKVGGRAAVPPTPRPAASVSRTTTRSSAAGVTPQRGAVPSTASPTPSSPAPSFQSASPLTSSPLTSSSLMPTPSPPLHHRRPPAAVLNGSEGATAAAGRIAKSNKRKAFILDDSSEEEAEPTKEKIAKGTGTKKSTRTTGNKEELVE